MHDGNNWKSDSELTDGATETASPLAEAPECVESAENNASCDDENVSAARNSHCLASFGNHDE